MRFLIVAHAEDRTAARVCLRLRSRHGADQVALVSSEELAVAPYLRHQLEEGGVSSEFELLGGRRIPEDGPAVVFNRLRYASLPQAGRFRSDDRDYAVTETYAFFLSWLQGLSCPVVNPPSPRGLGTQGRSLLVWLALAARAGLPVRGSHWTTDGRRFGVGDLEPFTPWLMGETTQPSAGEPMRPETVGREPVFALETLEQVDRSVLVAGERVLGAPDPGFEPALDRLGDLCECDLLQVTFGRGGDGWKVSAVETMPQARDEGEIDTIVDLLELRADATGPVS